MPNDLQSIRLPFGQHKGKTFDQVPLDYLDWLLGQSWVRQPLSDQLNQYLNQPAIARELERTLEAKRNSR